MHDWRSSALAVSARLGVPTGMRIACFLLLVLRIVGADVRHVGAELEERHRWADAAKLYQASLEHCEAGDRLWLLTSLAEVAFEQQDYASAERWLVHAEQVVSDLPREAPDRIRLLNAWGTLHLVRGNLTAAVRELGQAVELGKSIATPEDEAASLHNLAAAEMHAGDLKEAVDHEKQALQIWRIRLGERHPYVNKAWISLSSAQGLRGEWTAAAESLQQALAITQSEEALANYAVVLDKLKRHVEAKGIRARLAQHALPTVDSVDVKSLLQRKVPAIQTR
jgi:tetratricopeptide (TPR) repeat protein